MTKRVQIINWKQFAIASLNPNKKTFIIYIISLSQGYKLIIYLAQKSQITLLVAKEMAILAEYLDYIKVFLKEFVIKLYECFDINKYLINLESSKLPPYGLIYSLKPVEFKTLKTYIETNLGNDFIRLFKSPTKIFILFV